MVRPSIDLVLMTGAGASREFGADRRPLPLMADLSDALIHKLQTHPGYLEATRLELGLDGQEFEHRLGTFLQSVLAFSRIDSVLEASATFVGQQSLTEQSLRQWHQQADFQLKQIVESIYEVLYEQLSMSRVTVHTAAEAYRDLFGALGITAASTVVLATTNYETVAEHALATLGWHPDAGEERYAVARSDGPPVSVDGLLDGLPRYVPVLHLHGCLGWYRRADSGQVYFTTVTQHQSGLGVPVMVLPDPEKSYDGQAVITSLWTQFEEALRAARRVLVLGHSLNDSALVGALKRNVEGFDRIGICVLPGSGSEKVSIPESIQAVLGDLPGARPIPLRFAAPLENANELEEWAKRTFQLGPRPGTA